MLFINRWFVSLLVALVVLDGGVQAYRYYKRMGNRFRPVVMKPMPVGRFGFVRAENPNADGAMDAKSGEESSEPAQPQPPQAPEAPAMDGMPMHEMHAPQMREMIHDSPHPVEIDMGPGMQARVMGFEGELDEGNFGRAAGDEGEEDEQEEGGQFRHFKHKHKKHKHVIHTHHHYHHKKGGDGYGHHGYGHHGYGKHGGYGGHHGGHGGGGHGYGHGDEGEGDDYEPTYGHHGRYRRSSMSESSPVDELASPDTAQALDRTAQPTHSSPGHPTALEAEPGTPGTVYRQSVSRRQLVRSKNERLARIGRDRAQRANRYADSQEYDSDVPCPAEYVEAVGEVVGSAQDREDPKVGSSKRPTGPLQTFINRMFRRPKKPEPVVAADARKPADPKTVALRDEIGKAIADQPSKAGPKVNSEMKQYLRTKEVAIVGGPKATDDLEAPVGNSTCIDPLPGTFLPELGTIVSVRFVDETGRERTIPFELTSRQMAGNGSTCNQATRLNYNFFYFHCLTPGGGAPTANGDRLRSMAKRMIEGLEGGRTGRTTGEGQEGGATGVGSGPQQRWLHKRRTKTEWRRRDANAGRRHRPMPVEKVIERRTPEELPLVTPPAVIITPDESEVVETEEKENEDEQEEEVDCDDPICSNFYVDEQKLTTTSTTPREPEHRLEELLEPKLVPFGNEIDQDVVIEAAPIPRVEPKPSRNSLWRGLSKRLSAFRERQADRSGRRKMNNLPEQPSTTTADPTEDNDGYDSNEIVEYYQQQDVGRVLYRMANGRLLEEPQRLHLRRSAEGDDEDDSNALRKRRLNRLSNRMNRRRKPAKNNAPADPQPSEGTIDKSRTPMINIGTFRMTNPKYDGAASAGSAAVVPAGLENTGAARSVYGSDMDNYIMQKVREYCSTSCAAGKSHPAPVIIMPPAAIPPTPVTSNEPIVGSSRQLIVQPPSTYEAATTAPAIARTSAPSSSPTCPTKIVKCIPKALASSSSSSSSKRSRKPESAAKSSSSDDPADEKESNPLVSLARGMRHYRFNPFRRLFGPFARL